MKGLMISLIGMAGGWIMAFTAAWIQNRFEIIALPPDIYFISYLPIDTHIIDFLLAGAITVVVCFLASLYPALQASKLSVIDVLRE